MTDILAPLSDPPDADAPMSADERFRVRIERQLRVLDELADIGLEVARAVERQAKTTSPETDVTAVATAYAKAARALRLTIMLQSKLAKELQGLDVRAEIKARTAAAIDRARRADPEYVHKARVENIVERVALEACDDDGSALDRLMIEAGERLDDEDLYGKVLDRPVGELVALICRDLGLAPDWARLAEEAWARAEIESGVEGSPFAELLMETRPPPLAGEVARSAGGGIPPPLSMEGACEPSGSGQARPTPPPRPAPP